MKYLLISWAGIIVSSLAYFGIEEPNQRFYDNVHWETDYRAEFGDKVASLGLMVHKHAMLVTVIPIFMTIAWIVRELIKK